MKEEIPYWMALNHISDWSIQRKNELIVRCFEVKKSIIDLFQSETEVLQEVYALKTEELLIFSAAQESVANYAFLAEDLFNQGYHALPLTGPLYPAAIKKNLKKSGSPPLLYAKGNLGLLDSPATALASSPKPNAHSLQFAANIVAHGLAAGQTLVISQTKGIEGVALEAALEAETGVVLFLPQGILTYGSGFRKFYKPINQGKLLVVSPHEPRARSAKDQAVLSQKLAFGMAERIFIAQTPKSPTAWIQAVEQKLNAQRFFIRLPEEGEKNGNGELLKFGGTAVDIEGKRPHEERA